MLMTARGVAQIVTGHRQHVLPQLLEVHAFGDIEEHPDEALGIAGVVVEEASHGDQEAAAVAPQSIQEPPLMLIDSPVMKSAAGEARNVTTLATSSGRSSRPRGVSAT
jgi:hypothetical protein